jgi:hypothetical protein
MKGRSCEVEGGSRGVELRGAMGVDGGRLCRCGRLSSREDHALTLFPQLPETGPTKWTTSPSLVSPRPPLQIPESHPPVPSRRQRPRRAPPRRPRLLRVPPGPPIPRPRSLPIPRRDPHPLASSLHSLRRQPRVRCRGRGYRDVFPGGCDEEYQGDSGYGGQAKRVWVCRV